MLTTLAPILLKRLFGNGYVNLNQQEPDGSFNENFNGGNVDYASSAVNNIQPQQYHPEQQGLPPLTYFGNSAANSQKFNDDDQSGAESTATVTTSIYPILWNKSGTITTTQKPLSLKN